MTTIKSFKKVISFLPLIWFVAFLLFVFRCYLTSNQFMSVDPKDIGMPFHHGIVYFTIPIIILSPIIWAILSLIIYMKKKTFDRVDFIIFFISYFLVTIFPFVDKTGINMWFMD